MSTYQQEVGRRRTFAIISHPDAGKTTLTEKLLLFGGAIQLAGTVKGRKAARHATSDWMALEQQRGISVTSSVMQFPYRERIVNLLDTPGHEDFSEDTYRTLTAVDSALMVIDAAKGVEERTIKLMEVCRLRDTPIMTFVNKLDREGRDPIDLMDEVEEILRIRCAPVTWPIGMGKRFRGVYHLERDSVHLFEPGHGDRVSQGEIIEGLDNPRLDEVLGDQASELRDEIELVQGASNRFDHAAYLRGELTPVFFGSAIHNFGVAELLDDFVEYAPPPQPRQTTTREVSPEEEKLTGFVFKIQANMDPQHRDRIAFLRICSGTFERNKPYLHVRLGQQLRFANPTSFMADKKEVIDEAYPGDVVGLHDTGNFKIGDTLTEGEVLHFKGIPNFSPEQFRYVENADPMKSKQLAKGLEQLMDEGVAQLFTKESNGRKIIGTVGALQFDVIQYRLQHEYGASCRYEPTNLHKACWITSKDPAALKEFIARRAKDLARDTHGNLVYLAESAWSLKMAQDNHPDVEFHFTSEMNGVGSRE